jgi:hypothetical protein
MTDAQTEARAIVEAVARAWASIDGHADEFDREKDGGLEYEDPAFTGHYEGYMAEAQELLNRSGLATALAAKDAELAELRHECQLSMRTIADERARAERAEAQLAEAKKALEPVIDFIDRVSGAALGIAMSGDNHPNPDGVLMDFSREGMALSASLREAHRVYAGGEDA